MEETNFNDPLGINSQPIYWANGENLNIMDINTLQDTLYCEPDQDNAGYEPMDYDYDYAPITISSLSNDNQESLATTALDDYEATIPLLSNNDHECPIATAPEDYTVTAISWLTHGPIDIALGGYINPTVSLSLIHDNQDSLIVTALEQFTLTNQQLERQQQSKHEHSYVDPKEISAANPDNNSNVLKGQRKYPITYSFRPVKKHFKRCQRVRDACVSCRTLKRKCSEVRPCERCYMRGLECIDSNVKMK